MPTRVRRAALIVLAAFLPGPALAASDLSVAIYGIRFDTNATVGDGDVAEGCAGATTGRTLLRFGTKLTNLGPDAMTIGDPGCPDCQTSPGAACQSPLFVCSAGLYVAHFRSAARFDLLDPSGAVVVSGPKRGYCFNDDECNAGVTPRFTSCSFQGISVGCIDDYTDSDPCQYLDVTDVPDVQTRAFTLRVAIDTEDLLPDPNRANDVATVALPGCGDGVVQPGEDCDAGTASPSCCDPTCHLRSAGAVCRPAASSCDAAEQCDGVSPACPADAALPDGTACGTSALACETSACRAGRCATSLDGGSCLVAGACVPDGTADPADACERCDASALPDGWSPNTDADAPGILCGLERVSAAVATLPCGRRLARAIASPARQLRRALGPGGHRPPPRALLRLADRVSRPIARAARHGRCDAAPAMTEVDGLMTQIRGFVGS